LASSVSVLKDAIATFERHKINVEINSKFERIFIDRREKFGFPNIFTLHALLKEPINTECIGTDVILSNINDIEILKAKELFLNFKNISPLEATTYGEIYERENYKGIIYINGLKVAEEENFLFSYNITSLNKKIKKALNRERTNVGRVAYSDRIQKILLVTKTEKIAEIIGKEFRRLQSGAIHEELNWVNVQEHAVDLLNRTGKYVFLTSLEAMLYPSLINDIRRENKVPFIIPENLRSKIKGRIDVEGNPVIDIDQFVYDYNDSFIFDFVNEEDLNSEEKGIYSLLGEIIDVFGKIPNNVKGIKISNNIRNDYYDNNITMGIYDSENELIVIHRNALKSLSIFCGIVIHELIHAKTGYPDVDRNFETALTNMIGKIVSKHI